MATGADTSFNLLIDSGIDPLRRENDQNEQSHLANQAHITGCVCVGKKVYRFQGACLLRLLINRPPCNLHRRMKTVSNELPKSSQHSWGKEMQGGSSSGRSFGAFEILHKTPGAQENGPVSSWNTRDANDERMKRIQYYISTPKKETNPPPPSLLYCTGSINLWSMGFEIDFPRPSNESASARRRRSFRRRGPASEGKINTRMGSSSFGLRMRFLLLGWYNGAIAFRFDFRHLWRSSMPFGDRGIRSSRVRLGHWHKNGRLTIWSHNYTIKNRYKQ